MNRPGLAAAILTAAFLAACGGGVTTQPLPVVTASSAPASASVAVGTSPVTQSLSIANGATTDVSVTAAAGTPANASIVISTSSAAPSGGAAITSVQRQIQAITHVSLGYIAFVSNVDVQLAAFPTFKLTFPAALLPAGATIHEAFSDPTVVPVSYIYDVANGPSGTVLSGSATGTTKAPKLLAGKTYVFAFYYETGSAATPTPGPSQSPTPAASATPSAKPSTTATASPTPVPVATGTAPSGSATFSAPSGTYNGLLTSIAPLSTIESGGNGNETFVSIPPGQTGNGVDSAHPNRTITLEVNDSTPLSNSTVYRTSDFNGFKLLVTYGEQFGPGGFGFGRYWIANGGTVTFENVGGGAATYRLTNVTFIPDPGFVSNQAAGTFTLNAVGTASPFTQ
jgi:hypothetical protein